MKILYLTPGDYDYVSLSLLHGLRSLSGLEVVDFPKADFAYQTYPPESRSELHGRGFTLSGLLPDVPIDRTRLISRLRAGEFGLTVFSSIWRMPQLFRQLLPDLEGRAVAFVDGEDSPLLFPYQRRWIAVRGRAALPRPHKRGLYFKRELTPATLASWGYGLLPAALHKRTGSLQNVREIAISIPSEKVVDDLPTKRRSFASHVVDPEVAAALPGADTAYVFENEPAYYRNLQEAQFAITTRRAGWDCLRHYEIAANGCVPCCRNLERKPPRCAPHGLNATNSIAYQSYEDLMTTVQSLSEERYLALQRGAIRWAWANTTERRATQFLDSLGLGKQRARKEPSAVLGPRD